MSSKGKARRPGKSFLDGLADFGEFEGPAAEMGLAVLSALSVVGIHNAISPSFIDLKARAKTPERENAVQGLWIGLGLGTLASLGIFFMFKKWVPAVAAQVSAIALFGVGMVALRSKEEEKKEEATSAPVEKPSILVSVPPVPSQAA